MDFGYIHIIWTILLIIIFIGISYWAFHKNSQHRFDQAAQLPFVTDPNDANITSDKATDPNKPGVNP